MKLDFCNSSKSIHVERILHVQNIWQTFISRPNKIVEISKRSFVKLISNPHCFSEIYCNNLFICFDPLHINYTELSNHKHWIKGFLCPLSWPITTCFLCKDHICLIVCLWVSKKIKSQIFLQMVELGYNFPSHWNAYASLKWIFIIVREIFYSNANQLPLWHMES